MSDMPAGVEHTLRTLIEFVDEIEGSRLSVHSELDVWVHTAAQVREWLERLIGAPEYDFRAEFLYELRGGDS